MHSSLWGNRIRPEIMDCPPIEGLGEGARRRHGSISLMKTTYTIARILLGILFGVLGFNGFVMVIPAPHYIPPLAVQFAGAMYVSHYQWVVFGAQVIAGLLVLFNRYVPFALFVLAAVLVNVLTFHITMWPQALFPMPIVAVVLWFLTAWPIRKQFAPFFVKKVEAA